MRQFVSLLTISLFVFCLTTNSTAQAPATTPQSKPAAPGNGPADPKAKKTYDEATKLMQEQHWFLRWMVFARLINKMAGTVSSANIRHGRPRPK